MRRIASQVVEELPCPPDEFLKEARGVQKDPSSHSALFDRVAAFGMVEKRSLSKQPWPGARRLAAFNAERLTNPEAVGAMLLKADADIGLLCEADLGMARSGNVHTVRELSASIGMNYVFGAEFVELDLGDKGEIRRHKGQRNACGLHGNAIVSKLDIEEAHLIRLEADGLWFGGIEGAQHRIGGRIALAARVAAPQPLWVVSTHLESKTDPADRQRQVRTLLQALDELIADAACIIGGDFNTKALPREKSDLPQTLALPTGYEPLFGDLREAGFDWQSANLASATQRDGPWKKHDRPFAKLDWFFVRGLDASNPKIIPAVDASGAALSDHDMLSVEVAFRE